MAMHAIHKILASKSGMEKVKPGEIVTAKVDLAGINDIYLTVLVSFNEMGGKKVWDPDKLVFFFDHNSPSCTEDAAYNQREMRKFIKEHGIKHLYEINEGICHMVLPEAGLVKPGEIVIVTDSHTTTHGAFGALSTGVGSTDLAIIMMTGELWFRVPDVINVKLDGKLQDGLMAKDVALFILSKLGTAFAVYKAIEFSGSIIDNLSVEERMVLCNMAVEMGAKFAYIQPDKKTIEYLKARTNDEFSIFESDKDFVYEKEYQYNLSDLEPQVAMPHAVNLGIPVWEAEGIPIDQVFIGSCTGGKLTDIAAAASILKGRKIAEGTRLVVTHASKEVLEKSIEMGYYKILLDAGAAMTTPGCGACYGGHSGVLTAGERCATTSNRNFPGRMGSKGSELYLVSPLTAAATAIAGKLTHPRGELFKQLDI